MDQTSDLAADVVVCGCGSSGLVAGLTAHYGGASVIMLEKNDGSRREIVAFCGGHVCCRKRHASSK